MKKILSLCTAAYAVSLASPICTFGAGYQIIEQGAANMGTAMAGSTVNANNNASAAYWNPGAAFYADLKPGETLIDANLSIIVPHLTFTDTGSSNILGEPGGDVYNCSPISPVPNLYALHKFSDDFIGTFSFTAPYGLEADYPNDWIGRFQSLHSFLFTLDFNPGISYRVNDWLTIGGGVSAQYMYVKLTQLVPMAAAPYSYRMRLSGDGWGIGGNIGFSINYAEEGRFGFAWRSSVYQNLDGNAEMMGTLLPIEAEVNTPHTFTVGWYQRLPGKLNQFAVMAEYAYTMWSLFEDLTIKRAEGGVLSSVREGWKDTSRVALGFHYYPDFLEGVTFRIGSTFDETPVRCAELRTTRIPCVDRVWLSTGIGYQYSENITFDIAYMYIFLIGGNQINMNEAPISDVQGYYSGHIHVVSTQVSFRF